MQSRQCSVESVSIVLENRGSMRSSSKIVGFSRSKLYNSMVSIAIEEQTKRLIAYAEEEVKKLGDKILTYNSANHMDRTGNLLNSLCWGVTYNGKMMGSGFYRDAVIHTRINSYGEKRGKGRSGGSTSFLHEFFGDDAIAVNGRQLAEDFLKGFKGKSNGWSFFIAILAPYWGYWEGGFKITSQFGGKTTRFLKFQVLTHVVDDVRMTLKPAETHLTVHVPQYSYKNPKYKKKKGIPRIGIAR